MLKLEELEQKKKKKNIQVVTKLYMLKIYSAILFQQDFLMSLLLEKEKKKSLFLKLILDIPLLKKENID